MKPLTEAERLDMFAMQIVYFVGRIQYEKVLDDATSKVFVDIRQASNDEVIEVVKDLIRKDRKAWGEYVIGKDICTCGCNFGDGCLCLPDMRLRANQRQQLKKHGWREQN